MRTYDATLLNEVANDPEVRPWLGGEGALDLSHLTHDEANVTFVGQHGGFIMIRMGPGSYEVHTVFRKTPNGYRRILSLAHSIVEFMFVETDCVEILTKVPKPNVGADQLCNQVRFQELFVRKDAWQGSEPISYRKLDLDRWAATCSTLGAEGAAFHDLLETTKVANGSVRETHAHDTIHDRLVGLAIKMAKAGNVMKGVNVYNRWATFTGYAPIECKTYAPAVIDIGDAVIQIRRGTVEILECR